MLAGRDIGLRIPEMSYSYSVVPTRSLDFMDINFSAADGDEEAGSVEEVSATRLPMGSGGGAVCL